MTGAQGILVPITALLVPLTMDQAQETSEIDLRKEVQKPVLADQK